MPSPYTLPAPHPLDLQALASHLRDAGVQGFSDGLVVTGDTITVYAEESPAAAVASYVFAPDPTPARAARTAKLADCDWTQLADAPLSTEERAAWAAYRQDLRDVPEQPGFPVTIEWPPPPA